MVSTTTFQGRLSPCATVYKMLKIEDIGPKSVKKAVRGEGLLPPGAQPNRAQTPRIGPSSRRDLELDALFRDIDDLTGTARTDESSQEDAKVAKAEHRAQVMAMYPKAVTKLRSELESEVRSKKA